MPRPPRDVPPASRRPGDGHVPLIAAGLALFFATLWLGVVVIHDTPARSAAMAVLIVGIAGVGYGVSRRPRKDGP